MELAANVSLLCVRAITLLRGAGVQSGVSPLPGQPGPRIQGGLCAEPVPAGRRQLRTGWLEECRKINPRSRATRKFQKRLLHRNGGPARLQALIFCKFPDVWRLPK